MWSEESPVNEILNMFDKVWRRCMRRSEEANVLREDTFINMLISNLLESTLPIYLSPQQDLEQWRFEDLALCPVRNELTANMPTRFLSKILLSTELFVVCQCVQFTQCRVTADWVAPRENDCSRMRSKASVDRLTSYINIMLRPVLEMLRLASCSPDTRTARARAQTHTHMSALLLLLPTQCHRQTSSLNIASIASTAHHILRSVNSECSLS